MEYRSFTGAGTFGATFTNGEGLLDNFTANATALNPASYRLNNYKQVSRLAGETLDQFRVDVKIPFDGMGEGSFFKLGGKYLNRDRFQDQTGRTFNVVSGSAAATRTIAADLDQTIATTFDGALTFGPTINFASAQGYVFANNTNTALFTINSDQVSQSKTNDYQVKEKILAGYVMANIKAGGLTLIPGVRVEKTEGKTAAIVYRPGVTTLASTFDSFGSYEYTDWFPGLNAKYEFSRNLQARAAVTTAIGRAPFVNLAPTVSIEGSPATVNMGNPNLKPQRAFNLDAGLEYYFPGEGGISVSAFYKRIRNPIFATTALNQSGTFGGVAVTNATVNSFGNGDVATVQGVEFAIQKPLTFLPSPLDGFGVNANLTLSGSDLKVPGRTIKTPLVGQASTIASGQLYYEKYGLSARVAVSYRSGYLDTDGGLNSADLSGNSDGYFGKITTIDARIGYRPIKYVEVFIEGTNLTDAQDYYYFSTPGRFREVEKYGRSMRIGLSLTY
ncbi:MAG: TonB-dependent receptor [Sphingomonadales bacterium]|nr:MAG: TonB-dependent receptor [Sphingomonadales bacterium]